MGALDELRRGCVFGAVHDPTYPFWRSDEVKWKRCLMFNLTPPTESDDAHYFIATASGVHFFRENPHLLSDVLLFPAGSYPFFPEETAVDFRELCIIPIRKLQQNSLRPLGHLSAEDIERCVMTAKAARQLAFRELKLLGLR
jgi:hypothetical protein